VNQRLAFWQQPEVVAMFAAREPDHRLAALVETYQDPPATRVLDLGCAGGRNTVFLAEGGFDVLACDFSPAMVAETVHRLTPVLGAEEAARRVRVSPMDDLSWSGDGAFDLVVALGVYHNAGSGTEWERALEETARVTSRGARVLVANFTPAMSPSGDPLVPVPGETNLYDGFKSGRSYLLDAAGLDAAFARFGFEPETATRLVEKETEKGRRSTVNALYRKR